ncbi:hypothetical protein BDB01DRAFT_802597 [Pilobolus umbonatus]|nr:hypothetical protein BDB01DRAFT_802597 [Pilobolus umbonatus]
MTVPPPIYYLCKLLVPFLTVSYFVGQMSTKGTFNQVDLLVIYECLLLIYLVSYIELYIQSLIIIQVLNTSFDYSSSLTF